MLLTTGVATAAPTPQGPGKPHPTKQAEWKGVKVGIGGFVTGIIYHPTAPDVLYSRTDIGGAYRWDARTKGWIPLVDWVGFDESNLSGVESIALDPNKPNRVFLGLGTYAQSWSTNGAIVRSDDRGRTWKRTDLPIKLGANDIGRGMGERLIVDPNDGRVLYFGSRLDGLWRSTDSGDTWAKVESFPILTSPGTGGISFVVADPATGRKGSPTRTLYAGFSGDGPKLFKSTDAGATWAAVTGGPPTALIPQQGKIDKNGVLYIPLANGIGPYNHSDGAVWKLDTRTDTWTDITPLRPNVAPETTFGYSGVDIDRKNPGTLVVTTNNRWGPIDEVFRSTDGGVTWKGVGAGGATRDVSSAPYLSFTGTTTKLGWWLAAIAINPNKPGEVLYGTGATIYSTDDITPASAGLPTRWYSRDNGFEETAVQDLISPPTGAHLLSAMYDLGGFKHDDLTRSPASGMFKNPYQGQTYDLDFAELKPNVIIRVGSAGALQRGAISNDGGTTWAPFAGEPAGTTNGGTATIAADASTIVWSPAGGVPSYSTDNGATWKASTGLPAGTPAITADRVDPKVFYTYDRNTGTFYRSTDGAVTFTAAATGLPNNGWQLDAVAGVKGELWLAAQIGGLWRSTDGGTTFTKLTTITAADNLGFGKAAPGRTAPALYSSALVGGVRGIFRSDDTGATWVRVNDDQHQWAWTGKTITGDPRIYGRVYVGSNGRGINYADTAGCGTPVKS